VSVFFPSFQIMASIRLNRTQGGAMAQTIASRLRLSKLESCRPRSLPKFLAFAILGVGVLQLQGQSYENWTGWSSLGGSLAPDRNPAVAKNSDGRLEVFFAGSDNLMYHAKQVLAGSEAFEPYPIEDARSGNPVMVRAGDNSPRPKGGFYEE